MLRKTLDGRTKPLGYMILDTAGTTYRLGFVLEDREYFDAAEDLFRQAIKGENGTNQEDPLALVASRNPNPDRDELIFKYNNALGNTLKRQCRVSESKTILARVLKLRKAALGTENLDIRNTQYLLGLAYRAQSDYTVAEAILPQAFQGREKVLGRNHPVTLFASPELAGESFSVYARKPHFFEMLRQVWTVSDTPLYVMDEQETTVELCLREIFGRKVLGRDEVPPCSVDAMDPIGRGDYQSQKHDAQHWHRSAWPPVESAHIQAKGRNGAICYGTLDRRLPRAFKKRYLKVKAREESGRYTGNVTRIIYAIRLQSGLKQLEKYQ